MRINVALQGGGAHGAFTWGVLDRLLEDDGIEIAGISGTSAGALNAAALKAGLAAGGREGAKASLDALWAQVGSVGDLRLNAWLTAWMPVVTAVTDAVEQAFPVSPQGIAAQVFSPYAYGPWWQNPLEQVVRRFDFTKVCHDDGPRLFVGATNVRSGKVRVFSGREIGPEVLLASACIPTVFQAQEITDPKTGVAEAYWDGGFTGNPALFPLFAAGLPDDILVVSINPLRREEVPETPLDIQNRMNEISFNASLLQELRAIAFVKRLIREGKLERGTMKDVLIHMIADDALMTDLTASTKLRPAPLLLARLKAAGRVAADTFLADHRASIGQRSSVDLPLLFG
nr:patatin-like phospholipase family protein [Fertoeibacter niger]